MKIAIIGRGNVATNIFHTLREKNISTEMFSSRSGLDLLPDNYDVYIYAVRDEALQEVVSKVHVQLRALHLHTSGTMPLSVFDSGTDCPDKLHCGILYPFQTFSKERLTDFSKVPVFIEAKGIDDISAVYAVALTLSGHVYETTAAERQRLHIAGVFASNFTNLMYSVAADIIKNTHIPFSALLPLIDETANKVHNLTPYDAQTGPARRHDENVIKQHLSKLDTEQQRQIYSLLTECIKNKYL